MRRPITYLERNAVRVAWTGSAGIVTVILFIRALGG